MYIQIGGRKMHVKAPKKVALQQSNGVKRNPNYATERKNEEE